MLRVPFEELRQEFQRVLEKAGFSEERGGLCARLFAENSLVGVASHGLNRFPEFMEHVRDGFVKVEAEPIMAACFGAWEQWDGGQGPGPINAYLCTERAMDLARQYGVGCVALRNTTHWMRAGAYGWKAAEAGFVFLCWTNTIPNMPPWGAREARLGNNPLVLAVPREEGPVVLDMAMSQFSYGKLETLKRAGRELPVFGGFDAQGRLTRDPAAVLESQRPLPIGHWKGAGLALLLDLTAAILSGGQTSCRIGRESVEYNISQVFIAFDPFRSPDATHIKGIVNEVLADLRAAAPAADGGPPVRHPGEQLLRTRRENLEKGVPVDPEIWQRVKAL